jgi:hypothetical protein
MLVWEVHLSKAMGAGRCGRQERVLRDEENRDDVVSTDAHGHPAERHRTMIRIVWGECFFYCLANGLTPYVFRLVPHAWLIPVDNFVIRMIREDLFRTSVAGRKDVGIEVIFRNKTDIVSIREIWQAHANKYALYVYVNAESIQNPLGSIFHRVREVFLVSPHEVFQCPSCHRVISTLRVAAQLMRS